MAQCTRCGAVISQSESFFDPNSGEVICRRCNSGAQIAAQERRAVDAQLEAQGVPAWALQRTRGTVNAPPQPCSRCRQQAVVARSVTYFAGNGRYGGAETVYQCGACGRSYARGLPIMSQLLVSIIGCSALSAWGVSELLYGKVWPDGVGGTVGGVALAAWALFNVRKLWGWGGASNDAYIR
jgi:hypothetical protein